MTLGLEQFRNPVHQTVLGILPPPLCRSAGAVFAQSGDAILRILGSADKVKSRHNAEESQLTQDEAQPIKIPFFATLHYVVLYVSVEVRYDAVRAPRRSLQDLFASQAAADH